MAARRVDFQGTHNHAGAANPVELTSVSFADLTTRDTGAGDGTLSAISRSNQDFVRLQGKVTGAVDAQFCWTDSDPADVLFDDWLIVDAGAGFDITLPRGVTTISLRCSDAVRLVGDFEAR